ncbi:capping protein, Arp2/3 and myosin-I linker protein 2-like [Pelodytes ibericus]
MRQENEELHSYNEQLVERLKDAEGTIRILASSSQKEADHSECIFQMNALTYPSITEIDSVYKEFGKIGFIDDPVEVLIKIQQSKKIKSNFLDIDSVVNMANCLQGIGYEMQACIVDFMEPREVVLMKPIQLKIKAKFEDLILVLTPWRAFLLQVALPLRVENTFSFLEINDIDIRNQTLVVIDTECYLYPFKFTCLEDLEQVVIHVTTSIKKIFPDSSPGKLIRKAPEAEMKFKSIANCLEDVIQNKQGPCGGFSETYAALCDYNGLVVREEIQWDVDNIYHTQNCREFRLLDFCHMETSDIALTVAALTFNQWFTKLYCKDFKLRLEISEQILYMIGKSVKLEELVLENCGLRCEFAIKLAEALDNNPGSGLHTINLSGNQIEDRGFIALSQHFEKHHKVLRYLNFSKTSMTSKGMKSLFQSLATNDIFSSSLYHLDLSGNPGILATEDSNSLYNFLGHCSSLCHLNLSGTDCALDSIFGPLLRGCCSSLSYLDVSRNVYSHKKVKDVPPAIMQFCNRTAALKHLKLSGTRFPPEALRTVFHGLASNDKISDLNMDLSDCELRSVGAQVIQDMIFDVNSLTSLDISGNAFDSEMVTLILSVGRSKSITHLCLGRNFNGKSNTSAADVLHRIVQLIQEEDSPVLSLSLADSRLKSGTNILLNALGTNNSLTKIDISGNAMGDRGAKLLAKALQINNKLRTVIWDRNGTTANGFLDIAHALEQNSTLREMRLPLNDIAQAYRMNPGKTEEALQLIQHYLQRNNQTAPNLPVKVTGLQEEASSILSQEMVNEMCTNLQERIEFLSTCPEKEAEIHLQLAEEAVKDANFTISVLPVLYEAWHSPYKNSKLQHKLEAMAEKISDACSQEIQAFSELILDTAENLCPKILQKSKVREKLIASVSDGIVPEKNKVLAVNLGHALQELINKLNDIKLSITATVVDKLTAEVLDDLTCAQTKLEEIFSKQTFGLPFIHIETEDMLKNKNLLDITKKDISAEECKIAIRRRSKNHRSIRPTPTINSK